MPDDPHLTRTSPPRDDGTFTFDARLDAGLGAAFATEATPGGWSQPPLLRDDPSDFSPVVRPDSPDVPKADPGRYQLLGEIARGGMGVILKGRDPDLGRDLAVKVLKAEFVGRAAAEQRFVEEAQVGGQLQHPGLVPVYELGRFADGRPYFTMKLVKGRTLAALLSERPDPSHNRAKFLQDFLRVCETVAYAHSRGVIHRDLKPANVMVGSFGEVQVMDWGLAKVLPQGGIADEERASRAVSREVEEEPTIIQTARGSGAGSETQAGSVLGTPAFMPPEQAGGEIEKLDERADVFGLGAVLCVILTERPPYVAATADAIRLMAVRGQLGDAFDRLDECGTDAELVALCKRCLAPEPTNRPRHAGEVAAAVSAYLTGVEERAHRAEVERAAAEARAIEEANTRRVAEEKTAEERKRRRVQAALAASVVGIVAVAGIGAWWAQRNAAALTRVEFEQQAAETARAEQDRQERAVAAAAARDAIDQAYAALEAGRWVDARNQVERTADRLAGRDNWPADLVHAVRQARSDMEFAAELEEARLEQADEITVEGSTVVGDRWGKYRRVLVRHGWAAWEGNPEDFVSRLEASRIRGTILFGLNTSTATLNEKQREAVRSIVDRFDTDPWSKKIHAAKADAAALRALADDPATLLQPAANIIWLCGLLNDLDRRIALYKNAIGRHPRDFWIHANLSNLLVEKGTQAAALEAVGHSRVAAALRPQSAGAHSSLGRKLLLANNPSEANFEFQEAARLDPNPAIGHALVVVTLRRTGKAEQATEWLRRGQVDDPTLGSAYSSIAWELHRFKDNPAAIDAIREAVRLRPTSVTDLGLLALLLKTTGDLSAAEEALRQALRIDPKSIMAHINLGIILEKKGDVDGAIASCREAIRLDPMNGSIHSNLSTNLAKKGDVDGAIASCREAIRINPMDSMAHNNLGLILNQKGDVDGAIASFREAIRIDPKFATTHFNLGAALRRKGDVEGAITCFREAIRLDPMYSKPHTNLGLILNQKGDVDGAITSFREAIRLDPMTPKPHANLGLIFNQKGDVDGAITSFREAIRIDPKFATAHNNLGIALSRKGDVDGAITSFREVLRVDPKKAEARNNLGIALRRKGDVDATIAVYKEFTQLDPTDANWHLSLAGVYLQKKAFDAAVGSAREAVRLAPQDFRGYVNVGIGLAQSGRPAEAFRETQAAMKKFPATAEDPLTSLRYIAACCAMQCADGKGTDAPPLAERPGYRTQALALLTADLAASRKIAPIRRVNVHARMQHWLTDPDWQSVRDPEKLKALPADERAAWAKLWADVRALRDATVVETAPPPRSVK